MNKQELIDRLKRHLTVMSEVEGSEYDKGYKHATKQHLAMIAELDEPERPVVPSYVADFYEFIKDDFEDGVYELCVQFYEDESKPSTNLYRWFDRDDSKPIETLVKMRLYGYEAERYKVALKSNGLYLGIHQEDGSMKTIFTREELAKYGFNNLDEYTVTEVEDE